jgi:hypothetical protein
MYGGSEAYESPVYPELADGIKPKELEISADDELSPTAISPVRRKRKKGKKKPMKEKPPEELEPEEFKEDDEEEIEWDMESAVLEKLEAKKTATTIEYPEQESSEVEWEPTTEDEGLETVTELEGSDAASPVRLTTMPAVVAPTKASCRWCEREISGKYIKGRRKKDAKTGDEYYVEGPFCSMKCSEEFIK